MRGDFRPFADDGDIDMRDHAAQFADQRCRVVQKNMRRRPPPAFVRGRKMGAYISSADRAQQCVGQRMQSRIGIGMTFQSELVRDPDTAQPDMISARKAVHVETTSGPYIGEVGTRQAFGCFEITRSREFQVHLLPLDSQYRNPRALRECYIIRERLARKAVMRSQNGGKTKTLRRLCAEQIISRKQLESRLMPAAQRVGYPD